MKVVEYIAGPGTGKTYNLIQTLQNLSEQSVLPEDILVITYTNKAVNEIKSRLAGRILDLPQVTTFHALAYSICQHAYPDLQVAKPQELERIYKMLSPKHYKQLPKKLLLLKNNLLSDPLLDQYQNLQKAQGIYDFDDLQIEATKLLDAMPGKKYRYLLIDEFQDTTKLQLHLIQRLFDDNDAILYVFGDPLQAIYGFRGANSAAFDDLRNLTSEIETRILSNNYRSSQRIIDVAHQLFPQSPTLFSQTDVVGEVNVVACASEVGQARYIINCIEEKMAGFDLESKHVHNTDSTNAFADFAILYRNHYQAKIIKEILRENGMPYQEVGEENFLNNPHVKLLRALLNFLDSGNQDELLAQLPDTWLENDKYRFNLDLMQDYPCNDLSELITKLIGDWELEDYFNKNSTIKYELYNLLNNHKDIHGFITYVAELLANNYYEKQAQKITLTTIHSSKGLEFKHVYLIGFNTSILPATNGDLNEEKRLLYVAMTRAKFSLTLTYIQNLAEISDFYLYFKDRIDIQKDPAIEVWRKRKEVVDQKNSQLTIL
jgi:superfamily I DNA/RNA helicase